MALFNYATRELSAKIVYYGPGLSGKTTNIEMVHKLLRPEQKGRLISLPTETDRTLFFDFLPLDLGQIKGFRVRFHLYTVPGQVFYNATRRLVLQGVDGVVFVADSQSGMEASNEESLKNLSDNLATYGKSLDQLPFVLQYNKRDLKRILSIQELNGLLNHRNVPAYEAVAKDGLGVTETLVAISRMVFSHLRKSLMMPGDAAVHEEIGDIADARMKESLGGKMKAPASIPPPAPAPASPPAPPPAPPPPPEFTWAEAEGLEEISELEEIPDQAAAGRITLDSAPAAEPKAPVEEVSPESGYEPPEGIEMIPMTPQAAIEAAPQAAVEAAPRDAVETAPKVSMEALAEEPPRVFDELESIEIEIPKVPEPPMAPEVPKAPEAPKAAEPPRPRIGVSIEGGGDLTFMRFESVHVSPDGSAVLPALFLDSDGNPVRIRIRVGFDEGRK